MAQLELNKDKLNAAGLQVIAVAMGEPKHVDRYCRRLAPSITCLTGDAGGEAAYNAYGLREGSFQEIASLGVLKAGFRAMRKGYVGGQPVGNVKMMPGTFIVDTQGRIAYTFYSNHVGDHPTIDDVITAARQINADKER